MTEPAGRASPSRPQPSWRRRLDARLLRWQARLEDGWADRFLPWIVALILTVLYTLIALARYRGLDSGVQLAGARQAAWLIAHGHAPDVTVTGTNLLAQHLPIGFYPLAFATRLFPTVGTLLTAQALGLALGVVPLWKIARDVAALRVGAAAALVIAYGISPTLIAVDLADFHPEALAVAPLLGAVYFSLRERWLLFGGMSAVAVAFAAELGLVVAGLGLLITLRGHRGIGLRAMVLGAGWAALAVLVIEPRFGSTGFIAPGAFNAYGDNAFEVVWGMTTHPHDVIGDLLSERNLTTMVAVFAPLLFLPVLSPRQLIPALPLQALYFIADVPADADDPGQLGLPLTVFAFVAATFALQRIGRLGVERVSVDRRVILALAAGAVLLFSTESGASPYRRPWQWDDESALDRARRAAVAQVPEDATVRASVSAMVLLAEREEIAPLPPPAGVRASERAWYLIDRSDGTPDVELRAMRSALLRAGAEVAFLQGALTVYSP